jgi:O-antigen/teichoic acid export membrane protein
MNGTTNPTQRVARDTLVLTVFQVASKLPYVIFFILLGNRALFGEEAYGRLEGMLVLANVFFILADLGLEPYLTRQLAREPEETTTILPGLTAVRVLLTVGTAILLFSWCAIVVGGTGQCPSPTDLSLFLGCVIYMTSLSGQAFVKSLSRSHHRMEVEGKMGVVDKSLTLVLGGAVLFVSGELLGVMWSFAIASCCAALYGLVIARSFQSSLYLGWPPAVSILKQSLPFALSAVCVLLFYNMDRLMLFHYGDVPVARYSRGMRLVMGLLFLPQMISIAIYPTLSKLKETPEDRVRVGGQSLQTLMFLAFPLVLGGWAVAGPLVDLLYGAASPETVSWRWDRFLGWDTALRNTTEASVLRILLLSLPFTCCNYLFGPALNALDKQVWNLKASTVTAIANIALNALLIPFLGPVGAAIATTITQALYCVALYAYLRKMDSSWIVKSRLAVLLAISAGMGLLLFLVPGLHVTIRIALGGAAYLAITGVLGAWPVKGVRGWR